MKPLTLFTWGYWGWGTATAHLVQAVDAVEASRGYRAPLFADIRISRSVRAPGFTGKAFEQTLGSSRHLWLDDLGNLAIREGGPMRIKNPEAAETLLDLAVEATQKEQRVLFFCSCQFPGIEGKNGCHRVTVARLVLEAAQRRNLPLHLVEWPGGEPRMDLEITLPRKDFEKVARGASAIPLGEDASLAEMAAVPWYSRVAVFPREDGATEKVYRVTGPARYRKTGWYLPSHAAVDPALSTREIRDRLVSLQRLGGFEQRLSVP